MAADPEHAFSRIYEEFSAAFDALDGRGLDFQRNLPETRLAVGLVARVDIANDDSRANSWAATTPEETLTQGLDRKSGVSGKSGYVRVDLGGRSILKKKKQ